MFRPICSAIFRLTFEEVECTIDIAFSLRDLVLQELVKIIVVCYTQNLTWKTSLPYFSKKEPQPLYTP